MGQWIKNLYPLQRIRHTRCGFCPWVGKILWRRAWQPTPVFLPGEFHGLRLKSTASHKVRQDWSNWAHMHTCRFSSVSQSCLRSPEQQHARLPCPSSSPGVCSNSCPLSRWCHPTILFSVVPFSSCPQSFPASGSFQMSQLFASGGQSIGVSASASVLSMNAQGWSPLGLSGSIFLQFRGFSRVFSSTTVQKHQFFGTQLSL